MLYAGVDQRFLRPGALTADDATVPVANDVPAVVENILQVLPQTETVAVILGRSPLERFWRAELGRELEPFESRVRLLWWDELSGHELLARAASLPRRSAIVYVLFHVDATGIPHASPAILAKLHEVAGAPIFGLFDSQLGQGIVGGPLVPIGTLSRLSVEAATRILRGESPANVRLPAYNRGRRRSTGASSSGGASTCATCRRAAPSASGRRRPGCSIAWPVLGGVDHRVVDRSGRRPPDPAGKPPVWPSVRSGR